MAHTMAPPRPAYLAEASSLKSFRSTDAPSTKSGSVKARSFVFLRRSFLGPKMKDPHAIQPFPLDNSSLKAPISPDAFGAAFPPEKENTVQVSEPPRPRRKSLLHRISTAFRKEPKPLFSVPPLPPVPKQQRDGTQLQPSPKDFSQQQVKPDSQFTVLRVADSTAADRIKREWEEKTRLAEAEQRERMSTFRFGRRSAAYPVAVTVTKVPDPQPSSNSASVRKKAPPSLKLRPAPSGPPPDRALPPSPSQAIQFTSPPNSPHLLEQQTSSPRSPSSPRYQDGSSDCPRSPVVATRGHLPPSPRGSAFKETIDPNSLSPPRRFPISSRPDESSICAPSLGGSSVSTVDYPLEFVNSPTEVTFPMVPIPRGQGSLPFDLVQDEDEIDPCRPSPFAHDTLLRKPSGIFTEDKTTITRGTIAIQVAAVQDDASQS